MNVTKTISIMMLAAAAACAQSTTATPAKKPAAKPAASTAAAKPANSTAAAPKTAAKAATKPASQMAPAAKAVAKPATTAKSPVAKPAAKATHPVVAKTTKSVAAPKTAKASKPAKPAKPVVTATTVPSAKTVTPAQRAESLVKPLGKRDPFVSVIVARGDNSANCTGGKRCLIIDQIALRGIVRTQTKWIAMVENPAKKTYYLYENDPIYNAVVVRITGDSVIFREQVMDALGHATEREVVKRVNAPAI